MTLLAGCLLVCLYSFPCAEKNTSFSSSVSVGRNVILFKYFFFVSRLFSTLVQFCVALLLWIHRSASLLKNLAFSLMLLLVRDNGVLRLEYLAGSTTCRQYFKPSI